MTRDARSPFFVKLSIWPPPLPQVYKRLWPLQWREGPFDEIRVTRTDWALLTRGPEDLQYTLCPCGGVQRRNKIRVVGRHILKSLGPSGLSEGLVPGTLSYSSPFSDTTLSLLELTSSTVSPDRSPVSELVWLEVDKTVTLPMSPKELSSLSQDRVHRSTCHIHEAFSAILFVFLLFRSCTGICCVKVATNLMLL